MIRPETKTILSFNHIEIIVITEDYNPHFPWEYFEDLDIFEQGEGWIVYDNTDGELTPQMFVPIPDTQIIKNMEINELFSLIIIKNKKNE